MTGWATARLTVDLERYLTRRVTIRNTAGGRGYDQGVRTFDCPLCGERKGRGWLSVTGWTAGCFNLGCAANERLDGGAAEWVARVERITRPEAWQFLLREFRGAPTARAPVPERGDDWVTFPKEVRWLRDLSPTSPLTRGAAGFLQRQWGLGWSQAAVWGLGSCWSGPYARRIVIPICMPGPVAFQARALLPGQEPKYRTSAYMKECGRPASAMLFNYRPELRGAELLLVEGPGDAMRWHRDDRDRRPHALALLGVALTPEKLALIAALEPSRVIPALDNEPAAQARGRLYAEDLRAWGFPVQVGAWVGGKDSGSGADLERGSAGAGPASLVSDILRGY